MSMSLCVLASTKLRLECTMRNMAKIALINWHGVHNARIETCRHDVLHEAGALFLPLLLADATQDQTESTHAF